MIPTRGVSTGSRAAVKKQEWMITMNCLICVGVAERTQCRGPWEERDCPDCGRYRVCDEPRLTLMDQDQIFDINTRNWLDSRRNEGITPSIEVHEALLLL